MAFNEALCEGCPIQGQYRPLESRGAENAKFLVVTDVPSQAAGKQDRLLTNNQMALLGRKLTGAGFAREDFRFTPACHCPYDPDNHVGKEKTAAHKHCRQHLLAEVENTPTEAIIPLGALAASQVFGRSTKITKVRGIVTQSEEFEIPVFPLMSPGLVVMYPQNEPVFDADIASLARAVNAGYDIALAASQQVGDYEIIEDLQFLIDMDPELICFDTENTGLRWYQSGVDVRTYNPKLHKGKSIFKPRFQILTMQFTVESGKGYMLIWDHPERPVSETLKPKLRNQLRRLLCDEKRIIVGQNTKYDNVALWMTERIRFRIGGDTLMLATLVDENLPEKNLDTLTKIYVPEMGGYADVFNATYDKSRMWEVPLSDTLSYGCGDTDAGFRLYHKLEDIVSQDEMQWAHYCHVTIPGLNAFAAMETRGMFIDEGNALADFKAMMIEDVARMESECLHAIPRSCRQSIAADYLQKNKGKSVEDALSFTRTDFVKQVLFTHPQGFKLKPQVFTKTTAKLKNAALREPSTSAKDHLPYFFDICPFTMQLAEFQKDRHLLNTNVLKFEENYIRGGKVRPNYHLHKTVTGRSNSDDPNGQNYPKRGARAMVYRKMFIAPPDGYVPSPGFFMVDEGLVGYPSDDDEWFAIEADLSQAELRIAASMSGDKTMIEIYRTGGDIHKATALIVSGLNQEQFEALPKKAWRDASGKEHDGQKELRQKAKACIAEGQLVLTRDRGLVPIEKIKVADLVWDGLEWVHHEGVVYQGYREVITHEGLTATPDHRVYTRGYSDTVQFGDIASQVSNRRIAIGAIGETPVRYPDSDRRHYEGRKIEKIRIRNMRGLQAISNNLGRQFAVGEDKDMQVPQSSKVEVYPRFAQFRPKSCVHWGQVRLHQTALQQPEVPGVPGLRRSWDQDTIRKPGCIYQVCIEDDATKRLFGARNRPPGQRWALLARQFAVAHQGPESSQQTQLTTNSLLWANDQCDGFMGSDNQRFSELQVRQKLDVQDVPRKRYDCRTDNRTRYAHVYDIVNAGPRHRFTVSGRIVSNCNFGFLYGMGWRKFIGYAKTQYAVEFTEKEAQRIRTGFFNKYRSLARWHTVMREFAEHNKFVRSYTGRIRHLPMIDSPEEYIQQEAGRQAINSPVQETGSSLGVMALGRINEEVDPHYMQVVGFIHDAIVVYVRKKHLTWGMRTLKHYMQTNPLKEWFGTEIKVPIIADVGFGTNLGEIHECEGFSLDKLFDYTSLKDKDTGELLVRVPPQKIPPNNGKLSRSAYTTASDLEDEDAAPSVYRHRMIRATINLDTVKRVKRSMKQMVINRRNQAVRKDAERAVRALPMRRTRPAASAK